MFWPTAQKNACEKRSSDPESHPKVGFESVSGFGFRVSSIETNFRCRFRVSGFGFRRLKPTFAVGFGFRVSGFGFRRLKPTFAVGFGFRVLQFETNFNSRFRVSGFGFRVSGFGFRVSIGPGEVKSSESVSGFGFRVSLVEANSADLSPDHVSKNGRG